jgi:hypothetical protein
MDEDAIRAIRRGVIRGLSQYLTAEGEPPVELQLLLHQLKKGEVAEEDRPDLVEGD